ncbi:hypothetical protein [Pedobacter nutrimenti]|uniref:Uncharacterized protein n=1 Tax=Pedobacter nutrimenti TaxID=1241337 RepID=A0A318UH76_9SPHI|nr:hypothetical protein [Pedobacter nutrimenti]PYF74378.1 hypothetical protein B0O44_104549 [Pedobacter nutrimenti]
MKSISLMSAFCTILLFLCSFSSKTKQSEWGAWNSFTGYPNIEFRVKNIGYNSYAKKWQWNFQFRNSYSRTVTFNYGYTSAYGNCVKNHTIYRLAPGEKSGEAGGLIDEANRISLCIDKVEFSNSK